MLGKNWHRIPSESYIKENKMCYLFLLSKCINHKIKNIDIRSISLMPLAMINVDNDLIICERYLLLSQLYTICLAQYSNKLVLPFSSITSITPQITEFKKIGTGENKTTIRTKENNDLKKGFYFWKSVPIHLIIVLIAKSGTL